jgi:hypothetical protein
LDRVGHNASLSCAFAILKFTVGLMSFRGGQIFLQEIFEDAAGDLAAEAAPEHVVGVVVVRECEEYIWNAVAIELIDEVHVAGEWDEMIGFAGGDQHRGQAGARVEDRRDCAVTVGIFIGGAAGI